MKQAKWKGVLLALYITTVMVARALADQFNSLTGFFVVLVLGYCGIIVVAHLVQAVVDLCNWITLVIGREPQADFFTDAELDAKSEAS